MQVPNHIHSRHWIAQKPSSASKKRLEVSRTGKQRPDKAQNLDVLVEISAKQPELTNEFENAFYKAIQIRRRQSQNACRLPRRSAILYPTSLSPCLRYLTDKVRIVSQRRNPSVLIDRSNGLRWRSVNFLTLAVGNIVLTIEKS